LEKKYKFKFSETIQTQPQTQTNNIEPIPIYSPVYSENDIDPCAYENNRFKALKFKKNLKKINNKNKIRKEIKMLQEKKYYEQFITLDLTTDFIKKSLFKLNFPIKVNHYDVICNELQINPHVIENKKSLEFINNKNKKYIFDKSKPSFNKKPSCWIKYYAPNIGVEEKKNFEHEIPFWIDKVIYKLNCYEDETDDINHIDKNTKMIYFPGSIVDNNVKYDGVYEYFINGTGTLFHRMFRKMSKLKPNIKNLFE
jgi:hypothetical protein